MMQGMVDLTLMCTFGSSLMARLLTVNFVFINDYALVHFYIYQHVHLTTGLLAHSFIGVVLQMIRLEGKYVQLQILWAVSVRAARTLEIGLERQRECFWCKEFY